MLGLAFSRALRQFDLAGALLVVITLASCTGSSVPATEAVSPAPAIAAADLPGLPFEHPLPRSARTILQTTKDGSETFEQSAGALVNGSSLQLAAPLETFEYAIYQFALGSIDPVAVDADFSVAQGENAWLAAGNFARGRWEFLGGFSADPSSLALTADHISGSGNIYILALAYDLTDLTVNSIELTYDDGQVPAGRILGHIESEGLDMPGVLLTLAPGGDQETTDANGDFVFADITPGNYTVNPSFSGFTFEPASRAVTVNDGEDTTGVDFIGTQDTGGPGISGFISDGVDPISGVKVVLIEYTGVNTILGDESVLTDEFGGYSFQLDAGTYRVVPLLSGTVFTPNRVAITVDAEGPEEQNFTGISVSLPANVNYTSHMRPWLFEPICMNCHSSEYGWVSATVRHSM